MDDIVDTVDVECANKNSKYLTTKQYGGHGPMAEDDDEEQTVDRHLLLVNGRRRGGRMLADDRLT